MCQATKLIEVIMFSHARHCHIKCGGLGLCTYFFPYGRNCQQVSMFGLYSYHAVMDTHTNDLNKNLLIHGKIELIII